MIFINFSTHLNTKNRKKIKSNNMNIIEIKHSGLGIFGWIIVMVAGTIIWNMITKKKEGDKPDNGNTD